MSEAFWGGQWGRVFELIALGLVSGWVKMFYQKTRARQSLSQDDIEEIDAFTIALHELRKLYQQAEALSRYLSSDHQSVDEVEVR